MDKISQSRAAIAALYHADEADCVKRMLPRAELPRDAELRAAARARTLVETVRQNEREAGGLDAFLNEFGLDTDEGVVLMCLAEAFLRIPDEETANLLIRDKIGGAAWEDHLGGSESLLVNASTWALMLGGRVMRLHEASGSRPWQTVQKAVARAGEPVIRQAVTQAMRIMSRQFVMGRDIEEALARARDGAAAGVRHSFDMLGEAALTAQDAERYFDAYHSAIEAIGASGGDSKDIFAAPSISVKLSALHPRFEYAKGARLEQELAPRLMALAETARQYGVGLSIDAEEAERLEPTLDMFAAVYDSPAAAGWEGLGLVVQAYLKHAPAVIDWLAELARAGGRRIPVRLVKGAYWDSEIKRAQEQGLDGYPVYTRKAATDISYIACARRLLNLGELFYPQFATHNARTLATVAELSGAEVVAFEFQRLHGMGKALYAALGETHDQSAPRRVYAPVGSHKDLLPYLVRRLLENGANTSFVNRLADDAAPIDDVIRSPAGIIGDAPYQPHPGIPLPARLFAVERENSAGVDLSDKASLAPLLAGIEDALGAAWTARPIVGGVEFDGTPMPVLDPSDQRRHVGTVIEASESATQQALAAARAAFPNWSSASADTRASALEKYADLIEARRAEAMALCIREAGKTIADAVAEVREAVDFARYYAARARADFSEPIQLPGPTGEDNHISLAARGVFACISPWNFPLAIFSGQVLAALAAGNAVIAKPAEQTPLIAAFAVRLMHQAGIPEDVLHLLPGAGASVGAALTGHEDIAGVAFTGSEQTARRIAAALAAKPGPLAPLIAETGGQNVMIVDSSALLQQAVGDAVTSAFSSAGQRCSCLRVVFVQEEIAAAFITMLGGAMQELELGDPKLLATDVGPLIDGAALGVMQAHAARMEREATLHSVSPLPESSEFGFHFAPRAFEIGSLSMLQGEVFGPILHIVRYSSGQLDAVVDAINKTGYGLTLGIQSRIDSTTRRIIARARVGNAYVNRNMIGAVVGVQPFGGEGLSGTGPKAGGPRYLHRFATERTVTINTAASGGNLQLLSLDDDPIKGGILD
jgi:RHH-type transcriptional regulator, proline utilization regulon repressor / proline dehydrogenase / delta 1-pyrroline-5-carboxylate dehydrogenase